MPFLPPTMKLGQGYVLTGMCDSVHGGCLPQCMMGYHSPLGAGTPTLQEQTPLGADTPQEQTPPGSRHSPRSRHPQEQTPPQEQTHPLEANTPWDQTAPQEQTPPPGADSPLGADTPPRADPPTTEHAGRYGQCAGSTHPTGMQSCCFW